MRKTYQIKKHFSIIPHSSNCVELRSGVWNPVSYTLQDEQKNDKLFKIINALDGGRELKAIAKEEEVSLHDIEKLIQHLEELDVIEEKDCSIIDYYANCFTPHFKSDHVGHKSVRVLGNEWMTERIKSNLTSLLPHDKIRELSIADNCLKPLNQPDDSWLYDALAFEKVVEQFEHWKDDLIIVAMSQVNPIFCSRLNRICYALNIPWLHGAIDGPFILIGPTFHGRKSPCFQCFETRVYMNLREQGSYQRYKKALANGLTGRREDGEWLTPIKQILVAHLSLEAINFILMRTNFTLNKVLSFYLPTMEISFNEVLRESSCSVCSAIQHRDNQQLYFDYQTLVGELSS